MNRRKLRRHQDSVEINLTPLIDVVFLLLIFFMISTTFIQENRLAIELPEASRQSSNASASLELTIDASGNYFVGGRKLINGDARTIADALEQLRPEPDSRELLISADAQVEHRYVVRAMDVAGRLGFNKLSVMTRAQSDQF